MSSVESSSFRGVGDDSQYKNVETLQSQLLDLEDRMRPVVRLSESFGTGSRRDELKMVADAVKEALDAAKKLNERLISNASAIREELEALLLKEDESDSSLRLKRLLRASGSGEDVDSLKSQIEEVSCRLIEAQSHKLLLESKLQEKDKIIKSLQENLANTLADMKHIRAETQKSISKHEKRTREAESRVKSMTSELKRANEMATRYKTQYENEKRRKSTGPVSTTNAHNLASSRSQHSLSREATKENCMPATAEESDHVTADSSPGPGSRERSNTMTSNSAKDQHQDKEDVGRNSPDFRGAKGKKTSQNAVISPRLVSGSNAGAPVHLVEVTGSARTCLNVEDIIRKNH